MKTEAQIFAEILESNQEPESIILDNDTIVKEIVIQAVMAIRHCNAQEAEQFLIDACNVEQLPF